LEVAYEIVLFSVALVWKGLKNKGVGVLIGESFLRIKTGRMEKKFSKIYPQKWAQAALLIGFCIVLYFLNLGQWDLWNPDEPRYAQVAREMVNGGDWILMHYNGKIYDDKPPLFFWLIAFSSYLWQGFSSFSVRFPAALFGTLTVLLTFFLGKILYTSRTGFLSGLILATSLEFAYLSTRANMDTTLTFFTTASLFCFFQWVRWVQDKAKKLKKGEGKDKTGNLWIYGLYIGMALATLTKGPVGFILPLSVSLIYLVIQKDWEGIKRMRLLTGMGLFLVIVLSWYLPAVLKGGEDYLHATLFRQTVARYSSGWSKVRPIYYYLYNFPADFLPWILFVPAAVAYGFSREKMEKRRELLFLFTWSVLIFVFFSLSKGKRPLYLLPLYPAVSIMVGKLWDDFISTPMEHFRNEWVSIPLYVFMGIALVAGAAIPWVLSIKFPSYLPYGLPITFLLVGGGLVMFVLYRFKNTGAILFLLIGMMTAGYFYTSRVVFPIVNQFKSARFTSQEITARIQPGEQLAVYGRISSGPYNFYTGIVPVRELNEMADLLSFLGSSERVFCLIHSKEFLKFLKIEGRPKVQLISRRTVGDEEVVLVSNR
jgi:4-amino-4-deoxy-L-arabinose transferase-like glycosyltransferase